MLWKIYKFILYIFLDYMSYTHVCMQTSEFDLIHIKCIHFVNDVYAHLLNPFKK
jgi:hypothetical protein